jgi:Protein kinase domain
MVLVAAACVLVAAAAAATAAVRSSVFFKDTTTTPIPSTSLVNTSSSKEDSSKNNNSPSLAKDASGAIIDHMGCVTSRCNTSSRRSSSSIGKNINNNEKNDNIQPHPPKQQQLQQQQTGVNEMEHTFTISDYETPTLSHFEVLRCVGRGAFGKVSVVEHRKERRLYALKYIDKTACAAKRSALNVVRERMLLEVVQSPFVCNLRYAFHDTHYVYMALDLMLGGDLRFHLSRHGMLAERLVRFYVACLVLALNALRTLRVVHRDIKPDNVLLCAAGYAHLSDFNVATQQLHPRIPLRSIAGSRAYMAPEIQVLLPRLNNNQRQKHHQKQNQPPQAQQQQQGADLDDRNNLDTPERPEIQEPHRQFPQQQSPPSVTYGPEVDWWSLGITVYELLIGTVRQKKNM